MFMLDKEIKIKKGTQREGLSFRRISLRSLCSKEGRIQ
jgi:hypothetical protein